MAVSWSPGQTRVFDITCPSPKSVVTGGVEMPTGLSLVASRPYAANTWRIILRSDVTTSAAVTTYAICAVVQF
jgi:hypothetical protein